MFIHKTTVKMHDTDAAGVLFFGHQFKMMHDAYEALLDSIGMSFATILRKTNFFIPVVHAEADYKAPLFVGDKLTIEVRLSKIGTTSFVFDYILRAQSKKIVGTGKTVHVAVNKRTKKKIPLPQNLKESLKKAL